MSMNREPVGDIITKLVYAGIGMILAAFVVPVGLSTFGILSCVRCDPVTYAFVMVILPFALVFCVIYFIWLQFAR